MTREELDLFLLCSAGLCLLMAIFNIFRARSKGASGYILSGAFLAVGATLMLYRANAAQGLAIATGAIAFCLLVADFMLRARNQVIEGSRK